MAEIEDRLVPCDGLNNYNVFMARMELEPSGGGRFTFSLTHSMMPIGEFAVAVPYQGQSLDRMAVEAHDGLVDILRQLTFRADKARAVHLKQAERVFPPPPDPETETAAEELILDTDETTF